MQKTADRALLGVTLGHAVHDCWYGVTPILLAALSSDMQLTNADIALILLAYQTISSVTQPLFGRVAERIGGRPLAVGSILWTTLMFSGVILAPSKAAMMLCIGLAGFGSGAWHPQGAANATISGGARWGATAASIFFLGGTLGNAVLGAALGGFLLDTFGRRSLFVISGITVVSALTLVRGMVPRRLELPERKGPARAQSANGAGTTAFWTLLIVLLLATALRRTASESLSVFFAKYQQDLGMTPAVYGFITSFYMISTAVGGVLGSYISDRVGLQRTLTGSILLTALLTWGFVSTSGNASYVFFVVSGLFMGPSHTLFMLAGQRQFPQRMAMMTGVFLGFSFISGAVGAWVVGLAADRVGLHTLFSTFPWMLAASALFAYLSVPREAMRFAAQREPSATG